MLQLNWTGRVRVVTVGRSRRDIGVERSPEHFVRHAASVVRDDDFYHPSRRSCGTLFFAKITTSPPCCSPALVSARKQPRLGKGNSADPTAKRRNDFNCAVALHIEPQASQSGIVFRASVSALKVSVGRVTLQRRRWKSPLGIESIDASYYRSPRDVMP